MRRHTNADSGTVANVNTIRDTWSDRHPDTDDRTADAMSYGVQSWGSAVSPRLSGANGDTHEHAPAYGDENAGTDGDAVSARMLVERHKMQV